MNPPIDAQELLAAPDPAQQQRGYFHTLREILQQPATWRDTCSRALEHAGAIGRLTDGIGSLTLAGSGSSLHTGESVRWALREELGIPTEAIGAGLLLTHGPAALPFGRPRLLVSIARSGDSPESGGALARVVEQDGESRHLIVTCNVGGYLRRTYADDPRVHTILLDECTNDRSLAMTSSVTNMALAARFLGMPRAPDRYRRLCEQLSQACEAILRTAFDPLARAFHTHFHRVVFLAGGARFAAARESALKMLEMTDGRVATLAETYLGLRHGPMVFVQPGTLVVCFLSSDPALRVYELDLIESLNRKKLGAAKVIFGEQIPAALLCGQDTAIECAGLAEIGDANAPLLDIVIGQLLAFFRCLAEGLRPDSPCQSGAISRVVESFPVH